MDGESIFDYVMNSPEDTNPSVLRSVISNAKELPAITSPDDNGKVLTATSGKWKAKKPSFYYIIYSSSYNSSSKQVSISFDKLKLKECIETYAPIILVISLDQNKKLFLYPTDYDKNSSNKIVFATLSIDNNFYPLSYSVTLDISSGPQTVTLYGYRLAVQGRI